MNAAVDTDATRWPSARNAVTYAAGVASSISERSGSPAGRGRGSVADLEWSPAFYTAVGYKVVGSVPETGVRAT